MDNNQFKIAYCRYLKKSEQCELTFVLQINHEKFGYLSEEVRSVRKAKDNVASLLQHTQSIIIRLLRIQLNDENLEVDIPISLRRNEVNISGNMTCMDLVNYRNKLRFLIFNQNYRVIINAPLLEVLSLPDFIYSNTMLTVSCFKGIYVDRRLSELIWSKSLNKIDWIKVGSGVNYNTTEEDVGCYLKLVCNPKNSYNRGPSLEAICVNVVEVLPATRHFLFEDRHSYTKNKLDGNNIRIVSYNILAERYTLDDQFQYCDPKYLCIEYRKQLILKETLGYNADIICLQEVDAKTYTEFFEEQFKNHGYSSIFNRKGNKIPEGLVCIYNKIRFKKLRSRNVVLTNFIQSDPLCRELWSAIKRNEDLKLQLAKQLTSLQVTTLKSEETNDVLVVINTHLYYHWEAGHIRLLQIAAALKFIFKWCRRIKSAEAGKVSVIFCGDFNSRPDSGVYHFLTQRNLKNCSEELQKIGVPFIHKTFNNNFNFQSVCGTPKFTNYTGDFKGCLDYIFVEKNVTVVNIIPFPKEDDLSASVALPNKDFPSDHIALVADICL